MSPDSFDWEKYVELAEEIYQKKDTDESECRFRTGISRAYYGVYNMCKNFAIENNLINEKKLKDSYSSHADLIDKFIHSHRFDIEYNAELNEIKKDIGEILKELRDYRNDADYQNTYPGTDIIRDLEFAYESAKEALDSIKNLQEEMVKMRQCS